MNNVNKYTRQFFEAPQTEMKWTRKSYINKAPQWCSVDLRDGNQALVIPMSLGEKLEFFQKLVDIGFKEIEIGFPAASETEYDFCRTLIEQDLIPDDVTIQVLTQSREHIIEKTFEALKGCKNAIVHLYNSTSVAQREQVFRKSKEEIKALYTSGKIPEGCYALIQDLDSMAAQLLALKDKGIPVLWRPLHESSGDWFWWGSDGPDAYTWLWELMYKRYTGFFGLDNLIWIWNGQSDSYTVNKDTFDIASVDIYLDSKREFGSRFEQFAALQKIVGPDKLIALSECSCIPDADAAFRDNAVWSFFGLWYGKYIENNRGRLAKEYMDKDYLIHAYNSDGILTLDEYRTLLSGEKLTPEYGTEPSTEDSTADTTEETSGEEPAAEENNE